ncbi:MAG TPA: Crp/Fnr family transcriptional regulator [Candidatus Merdenecus merdavium]|nr:Crp/Fnr family transcriptional regulator [Candidatus Merdenecus merdavium]
MKKNLSLLTTSKLFANITEPELLSLSSQLDGHTRRLVKGEMLINEGDYYNYIGLVLTGELCVTKVFTDGTQSHLEKLLPTYIIGADIACTPSKISPYTVFATEDTSIWTLSYTYIEKPSVMPDPIRMQITQNLLHFISNENIRKLHKIEVLSKKRLRDRILTYLIIQSKLKNNTTFEIPFNRNQLADYLCVNRSALSHELSLMEKEGILTFHKNTFDLKIF